MSEVRIGVDTGGTFTDFLAFSEDGSLYAAKTLSTPDDDSRAFLTGLETLKNSGGFEASDVTSLNYGTTVALNAVLQKKWPPLGLIVTEGFREMIEIARQTVPGDWGAIYAWVKPPRVVPVENVREVSGRISHKGEESKEVNEDDIREAAKFYKDLGIEAVAVCFIHSYLNPDHEKKVKEIFTEIYPECFLTLSSEVHPEFREYERAMTTCLNAALMPLVNSYLNGLQAKLDEEGYSAPLLLMRSSGGLAKADRVVKEPATIAYSGPSAGVLGMAWLAKQIDEDKVLSFDMGGTSTDVALIENGEPLLTTEGLLDIYPMGTPSIDLVSIGAGGGSIASLGTGDRLTVGPESAGSAPGPICYGNGGESPTVTDANLVLGRIPGFLLGGEMSLDVESARTVIGTMGNKIGLSVEEFAHGIVQLAAANMAGAVRQVSVARGRDSREYSLFAYGGAGPLHATDVADLLGVKKVVVPPRPGLGSCLGLLSAHIQGAAVQTVSSKFESLSTEQMSSVINELRNRVKEDIASQGIEESAIELNTFMDLCYVGQATELTVPLSGEPDDSTAIAKLLEFFHAEHERIYGYHYEGEQEIEVVNIWVRGIGPLRSVVLPKTKSEKQNADGAMTGSREVYFGPNDGFQDTKIYDRNAMSAGSEFDGPAIVTEYDSTILVPPSSKATVDEFGNLIINL